ncbi:MAG: GNAT family N-acetyltransferase [Mycobacteriales bacterium]
MTAEVEVGLLPAGAAVDGALVAELTALVNRVYAVAEDGLWADGAARTTEAEMAGLVAAGEIAVARAEGGGIAGAVRVQRLASGEGEFGMLVAAPEYRGAGVGRALVAFAEEWCLDRDLTTLQLELLVPRGWSHPVKEFLRAWYTRLGYRPVRTGRIDDSYPALAPLLATPCDFVVYHKDLGRPVG